MVDAGQREMTCRQPVDGGGESIGLTQIQSMMDDSWQQDYRSVMFNLGMS